MITEFDLKNICINVARNLIKLPNEKNGIKNSPNLQTKLIFPQYERKAGTEIRISEQESRVLFCNELENYYKEIFYSVETPTVNNYRFGKDINDLTIDKTGQSALYDMSLFELENEQLIQKVNVEFKAHNVELSHIAKDILKLFAEEQSGLFFHTLKAVDSGTLNNGKTGVLDKYRESIDKFKKEWIPNKDGSEKYIVFAICIIEQKVLLTKTFKESDLDKTKDFFKIEYKPTRKVIEITNINNWIIKDLL